MLDLEALRERAVRYEAMVLVSGRGDRTAHEHQLLNGHATIRARQRGDGSRHQSRLADRPLELDVGARSIDRRRRARNPGELTSHPTGDDPGTQLRAAEP